MARSRDEGMERRIIGAAMEVFGEQGFQATTLKDIAAGAGISTGSIYTYFKDKEALFQTAVLFGWDSFNADLAALAESGADREARLSFLLDRGFSSLAQALPLLRGMLFDASKQRLVEPQLERVIASIDRLLSPDRSEVSDDAIPLERSPRQALIRILVTGILFSAALGESKGAGERLDNLRFAVLAFLRLNRNLDGQPGASAAAEADSAEADSAEAGAAQGAVISADAPPRAGEIP